MKNLIIVLLVFGCVSLGNSQQTYSLLEESVVTVNGTSTLHDWTVTANSKTASLDIEGTTVNQLSLKVEVQSIISERGATMDKKTHNALKKEDHPFVTFSAAEFEMGEAIVIEGKLSIAGVEKVVGIPVTISQTNGVVQISGSQKIVLQDYNMEPPTAMFGSIVVGDEVTVNFDLKFVE